MNQKGLNNAQWDWVVAQYMSGRYTIQTLAKFTGIGQSCVLRQIKQRSGGKQERDEIALAELEALREEFDALASAPGPRYMRPASRGLYNPDQLRWLAERREEGYYYRELGAFCYMAAGSVAQALNKMGYRAKHTGSRQTLKARGLTPLEARRAEFEALGGP